MVCAVYNGCSLASSNVDLWFNLCSSLSVKSKHYLLRSVVSPQVEIGKLDLYFHNFSLKKAAASRTDEETSL